MSEPTETNETEYVLGTHEEELVRLGVQHQIWRAQAYALWERAGFRQGQRILDVGCGPGYATLDLAQLVGPAGSVLGVDISRRFLDHVEAEAKARGVSNVETQQSDVMRIEAAPSSFDGAYARWILCFVADPEPVVERVARALRPGGAFAVQDYVHYAAVRVAPRSASFEKVVAAVDQSWRRHGGDPNIGCRIPELFERHGLAVADLRPLVRIGRPDSSLWQWPTTFFHSNIPLLVKAGLLTPADQRAFEADWGARTRDPAAFFLSPPMVEVVGRKRG